MAITFLEEGVALLPLIFYTTARVMVFKCESYDVAPSLKLSKGFPSHLHDLKSPNSLQGSFQATLCDFSSYSSSTLLCNTVC